MRLLKPVLFVTLGLAVGGASAATASSLITGSQVKNGTLTGKDIKNGSITRSDLAKSARGLRGPQGPKGDTGVQGTTSQAATPTVVHVTSNGVGSRQYGEVITARASCPVDAPYAVSGGFELVGGLVGSVPSASVLVNEPVTVPNGTHGAWKVTARNESDGGSIILNARAVCMNTPAF